MKFKYLLFSCFLFLLQNIFGQGYKEPFKKEICICIEKKAEDNPGYKANIGATLMQCYQETLPQFVAQMDETLEDKDPTTNYNEGQLLRKSVMKDFAHEMILSCNYYFEQIDQTMMQEIENAKKYITPELMALADQSVAMKPTIKSYTMRAEYRALSGNRVGAISDMNKAVALSKNNAIERFKLAYLHIKIRNYKQAITIIDALLVEKDTPNLRFFRAYAQRKSGIRASPNTEISSEIINEILKNTDETTTDKKINSYSYPNRNQNTRGFRKAKKSEREIKPKPKDTITKNLDKLFGF